MQTPSGIRRLAVVCAGSRQANGAPDEATMTLGENAFRNRGKFAGLFRMFWRQLIREVRRAGVAGSVKHATSILGTELRKWVCGTLGSDDRFDRTYGTDTAVIVRVGRLDIPDGKLEHTNRYEAVMPGAFDSMIR